MQPLDGREVAGFFQSRLVAWGERGGIRKHAPGHRPAQYSTVLFHGTHNPFRVTCGQGTTATWSPDLGRAGNSLRDQAIWVHRWGEAPLGGHPRSIGSLKVQQKQEKAKQTESTR